MFQGAAARARPAAEPEEEEAELATPAGVEVVSLDEVEAGEEKAAEPVVDDIDVEEDAEEAPDDPFLKRKRRMTTTSPTSSTAISLPTKKPEQRLLPKTAGVASDFFCARPLWGAASLRLYHGLG